MTNVRLLCNARQRGLKKSPRRVTTVTEEADGAAARARFCRSERSDEGVPAKSSAVEVSAAPADQRVRPRLRAPSAMAPAGDNVAATALGRGATRACGPRRRIWPTSQSGVAIEVSPEGAWTLDVMAPDLAAVGAAAGTRTQ